MTDIRRFFLGRRLSSDDTHHTKVSNPVGLAVFSSDALSSVAYGTQEIMASLSTSLHNVAGPAMALGATGVATTGVAAAAGGHSLFGMVLPVGIGITSLLIILYFSYRQTILAYPTGGGAYIVAHENLGELPAQVAGASLLIDYILTVAVSVASGVAAITAAAPFLKGHNTLLTLAAIAFVALMNLRGVKESGSFFAVPTYGFIFLILGLISMGFLRLALGHTPTHQEVSHAVAQGTGIGVLGLIFVYMRAYSAGCTALTGVEAISNGVTAFRDPAGPNAAKTLMWMVVLLGGMFMGINILTNQYGVVYFHSADPSVIKETLLSNLGRQILGHEGQVSGIGRIYYYLVQGFTFAILVVAANTAYADFPRLAALMAKDGYLPKQFAVQGDRLVFSNGIIILTGVACVLVWIFSANTDFLLPMYALGVVLGFTISQTGMVVHWLKLKGEHWHYKAFVNGLGAVTSAIVVLDIAITKFRGAWIVILLIPILVVVFFTIRRHYIHVRSNLAASRTDAFLPHKHHAIVLISSIHKGVIQALAYARMIAGDRVEALTVDMGSDGYNEGKEVQRLRSDWTYYGMGVPLRSVPSPYRRIVEPIVKEIERIRLAEPELSITVVVPEFVTPKWWQWVLHGHTSYVIKAALIGIPGVIVTSVRMHLPD